MTYSIVWNVDADGDWGTASNWSTGVLPGPSDDVGINTADFHTISLFHTIVVTDNVWDYGTVVVHSLNVGNDAFEMDFSFLTIAGAANFGNALTVEGLSTLTLLGNTKVSGLFTSSFGEIDGTGRLTLAGDANFEFHTLMSGSGKTVMQGTSTLGEGDIMADNGRILENQGTLIFGGASLSYIDLGNGYLPFVSSASLKNDVGATIVFSSDICEIFSYRAPATFSNAGTVENIDNAHSYIGAGAIFENIGTVHVQTGELDIYGPMKGSGTVTIDSGAIFALNPYTGVDGPEIVMHNNVNIRGTGMANLTGGSIDDIFAFEGNFRASDILNGAAGNDTLILNGNYSVFVDFTATTMINVETIRLTAGSDYRLATDDATVAAGQTLKIDGSTLGASDVLMFNGQNETDGQFNIFGGAADDRLTGGAGSDMIRGGGGNDMIVGGGGGDKINMGAAFTASDRIDGGTGYDSVTLNGDYSPGVYFGASTMINVEVLNLTAGHSYTLTANDMSIAAGEILRINGSTLGSGDVLNFNGAHELDGNFVLKGGAGADRLAGGAGNDAITGGAGADLLTGNGGADHFVYGAASQSTGGNYDTLTGVDFAADRFDLSVSVSGIDAAIAGGALNTASFDSDLTAALSGHLNADHAMLFTPGSGTLHGQTFLIVDVNGAAGYQTGADLVLHLTGATGTLAAGDFI